MGQMQAKRTGAIQGKLGRILPINAGSWCSRPGQMQLSAARMPGSAVLCCVVCVLYYVVLCVLYCVVLCVLCCVCCVVCAVLCSESYVLCCVVLCVPYVLCCALCVLCRVVCAVSCVLYLLCCALCVLCVVRAVLCLCAVLALSIVLGTGTWQLPCPQSLVGRQSAKTK